MGIWNIAQLFPGQGIHQRKFRLSENVYLEQRFAAYHCNLNWDGNHAFAEHHHLSKREQRRHCVDLICTTRTPPRCTPTIPAILQRSTTTQTKQRVTRSTRTPIVRVNPTVANGRVYVPTSSTIAVYGLRP